MNLRSMNDVVACVPFVEKGVMKKVSPTGVPYVGNFDTMVSSVAAADGPDGIQAGDVVYVPGTAIKQPWAKAIYEVDDDVKVVFVPKHEVKLVRPRQK